MRVQISATTLYFRWIVLVGGCELNNGHDVLLQWVPEVLVEGFTLEIAHEG